MRYIKQFPFGDYVIDSHNLILHGRRLKGKGKWVLAAKGGCEERGREMPARRLHRNCFLHYTNIHLPCVPLAFL